MRNPQPVLQLVDITFTEAIRNQVQACLELRSTGDGFIKSIDLQAVLMRVGSNATFCEQILAQFSKVRISEFMDWLDPSCQPNQSASLVSAAQFANSDNAAHSEASQDVREVTKPGIDRPPAMATKEQVTDAMRAGQRSKPGQWTMTLQQFNDVIDFCKGSEQYLAIKAKKRYVDMSDINELFVKKWTEGTGCSVAVLMSQDAV